LICRSLPFTADVAFFECACVPLLILCVRCAVPLTAVFAARAGWSAAGLIQMRLRLACRCRALADFLSRGLWMHGGTSSRRFYSRRPALAINSRVKSATVLRSVPLLRLPHHPSNWPERRRARKPTLVTGAALEKCRCPRC